MGKKNLKVVHLIPRDGLGGTEAAARSLDEEKNPGAEIWFMSGRSLSKKKNIKEIRPNSKLSDPRVYFSTLLLLFKVKPELVVCSLWRATLLTLLYKCIFPFRPFVIFLHSERFAHPVDKVVTGTAMRLAKEIWCDSSATRNALVPVKYLKKTKIISFLIVERYDGGVKKVPRKFVYWGRLTKKKRVEVAVEIFSIIRNSYPDAELFIYGPTSRHESVVRGKVTELGVEDSVHFMGEKAPGEYDDNIRSATFFLNPSAHEGMGVAVIEAMQLGIVPVVTPVGEIKHYCQDGVNAIVIGKSIRLVAKKIIEAIENHGTLARLSDEAQKTWHEKNDYSQDFRVACKVFLSQ